MNARSAVMGAALACSPFACLEQPTLQNRGAEHAFSPSHRHIRRQRRPPSPCASVRVAVMLVSCAVICCQAWRYAPSVCHTPRQHRRAPWGLTRPSSTARASQRAPRAAQACKRFVSGARPRTHTCTPSAMARPRALSHQQRPEMPSQTHAPHARPRGRPPCAAGRAANKRRAA